MGLTEKSFLERNEDMGIFETEQDTVEAIPINWFYTMIHSCGMQGEIGAVQALRWVLGQWKYNKEEYYEMNRCEENK